MTKTTGAPPGVSHSDLIKAGAVLRAKSNRPSLGEAEELAVLQVGETVRHLRSMIPNAQASSRRLSGIENALRSAKVDFLMLTAGTTLMTAPESVVKVGEDIEHALNQLAHFVAGPEDGAGVVRPVEFTYFIPSIHVRSREHRASSRRASSSSSGGTDGETGPEPDPPSRRAKVQSQASQFRIARHRWLGAVVSARARYYRLAARLALQAFGDLLAAARGCVFVLLVAAVLVAHHEAGSALLAAAPLAIVAPRRLIYSPASAAAALDISVRALWQLVADGDLPKPFQCGPLRRSAFRHEDLVALVERWHAAGPSRIKVAERRSLTDADGMEPTRRRRARRASR